MMSPIVPRVYRGAARPLAILAAYRATRYRGKRSSIARAVRGGVA